MTKNIETSFCKAQVRNSGERARIWHDGKIIERTLWEDVDEDDLFFYQVDGFWYVLDNDSYIGMAH